MKILTQILSVSIIIIISFSCSQAQEKSIIAEGAELSLVSSDFEFTEGPAADKAGNVFFTDQPNNRIYKWSVEDNSISLYMEDAGRANGLYFGASGNLYACADENSEIWKIDHNKSVEVLISNFQGKRLNGPNDLWIDAKGGIYITDPFYKREYWDHSEKEIEKERVYYLPPGGKELIIVAEDLVKPNGIIGTPNGKTLYVADIDDNKTYSYRIEENGMLSNKKLFTNLGSDGMTVDERGNVYLTGDGVSVFNPEGKRIEHIPVDRGWTANVTFGGKEHKTLFITAMNSLFTLEMRVKGGR